MEIVEIVMDDENVYGTCTENANICLLYGLTDEDILPTALPKAIRSGKIEGDVIPLIGLVRLWRLIGGAKQVDFNNNSLFDAVVNLDIWE